MKYVIFLKKKKRKRKKNVIIFIVSFLLYTTNVIWANIHPKLLSFHIC